MLYQIVKTKFFSSNWVQFDLSAGKTENTKNKAYESLGVFSQETNWDKVFAIGNNINSKLKMSEQEVIDEVSSFRKRKKA